MGYFIDIFVKIIILVAVFSALAGFGTYLERRVLGIIQRRLGPVYVGPMGLLQFVADGIKLFAKEDIMPANASSKIIFFVAPAIAITTALVAMAPIPFFPNFTIFGYEIRPIISDINIGILFVLAVGSLSIYAPLLAGLSSGSKYSLLGGARAALQLLSFEMVSSLAILAPIMVVGSFSLLDFNAYQSDGFFSWLIFKQPLAFVLFLTAIFVELNRTPFDLLEHEAEIVAGFVTEYSGLKWGMFFLGEYASMFAMGFVVSLVFLGGFNDFLFIPGAIMILLKAGFIVFFFMWVRGTLPHVRPDQLISACWKIMVPLALLNLIITALVLI